MKKIVINAPYDVRIVDVPVPIPGPQMLLVKTEISGISAGTEMMLYRGTHPNLITKKWDKWKDYPVNPGYELIGTVVAKGEDVEKSLNSASQMDCLESRSASLMTDVQEFKVGDRVVCLGEHAEYACIPAVLAAKIPDNIPSEEATLAVLATTAMHAVRRADIKYGDTVAVIGMGVLGYLTMQHMKNAGARRVIALDLNNERLTIARNTGADLCINPSECDPIAEIKKVNDGILSDVVIEASGFKGTEQLSLELLRDRGRIVILGWHTENIDFMFGDFYVKEATLIASQAIGPEAGIPYSYVRWCSDQSLKWAVDLISKGIITGRYFKPTKFSYTDIKKVYDMIDKRCPEVGLQTILTW